MHTEDQYTSSHTKTFSFSKDEVVAALGLESPGKGYQRLVFLEDGHSLDREPQFVVRYVKGQWGPHS